MANQLTKNHSTIKNYSYQKRGVALNFSLDTSDELAKQDFVELLTSAAAELQQEIDSTK